MEISFQRNEEKLGGLVTPQGESNLQWVKMKVLSLTHSSHRLAVARDLFKWIFVFNFNFVFIIIIIIHFIIIN